MISHEIRRVLWQLLRSVSASWIIIVVGVAFCIAVLAVTDRAYEFRVRWPNGSLELTRSQDTASVRGQDGLIVPNPAEPEPNRRGEEPRVMQFAQARR